MNSVRLLMILVLCVLLGWGSSSISGQTATPVPMPLNHPRQVFIERGAVGDTDEITFVDLITGAGVTVPVRGRGYMLLNDAVLYQRRTDGRVRLLAPDGTERDHAFIQPPADARRIDWISAPDRRRIAWTVVEGEPTALTTTTYVAELTGEPRVVLVDGPHDGIRAFPVAFTPDGLIMDYQPDTIADLLPIRLYAALFTVSLSDGSTRSLPGEAGCFCGAALDRGQFLRVTLTTEGGFALRLVELATLAQRIALPIAMQRSDLADFTQAGDVLLAPDGTQAIYRLLRVRGAASPDQTFETALIVIDLTTMEQRVLLGPNFDPLEPIAWTDDSSAVLLRDTSQPGTWQVRTADGSLTQSAALEFLGSLTPAPVPVG